MASLEDRRARRNDRRKNRQDEDETRDELFGGKKPITKQDELSPDRDNLDIIGNAIRVAEASRQVGASTASRLGEQTKQIEGMDRDLADMNASLARSERILTNMESFTGRVKNKFIKAIEEQPDLYDGSKAQHKEDASAREARSELKMGHKVELIVPKEVTHGLGLAKINQALLENKRAPMAVGEKLLYHYYNSAQKLMKDLTGACILLTNKRFIKIEDKKIVSQVELNDVREVKLAPGGAMRYDQIALTLRDDQVSKIGVWGKEAAEFFTFLLDRIVDEYHKNKSEPARKDIEAKAKTQKAKDEAKRLTDAALTEAGIDPTDPAKRGAELRRIKATPDSSLSEAELMVKRQVEKEDDALDVLIGLLGDLEAQAIDINKEMQYQSKLLDHVGGQVDKVNSRVQASSARTKELAK